MKESDNNLALIESLSPKKYASIKDSSKPFITQGENDMNGKFQERTSSMIEKRSTGQSRNTVVVGLPNISKASTSVMQSRM